MEKEQYSKHVLDILNLISDGFLFERLAQEFLTARLGHAFMASGGIKDKGIDGLEHVSGIEGSSKDIFQMSIDKNPGRKIRDTIIKLIKNNIEFDRLIYVTNQRINNHNEIIDTVFNSDKVNLRIYDSKWIAFNVNNSQATETVISNFVKHNLHEYSKPGTGITISDYVKDPKLYVYLMQQYTNRKEIVDINNHLIDSLIMYALRDTDPDNDRLLSIDEIEDTVKKSLSFELKRLHAKVKKRLKFLTNKEDKKVNYHSKEGQYCLPYESRLEIIGNNSRDKKLYDDFQLEAESTIRKNLKLEGVQVQSLTSLLHKSIEKIYYRQGLEFSDFLLHGGCGDAFEASLYDTVTEILEESNVIEKNKHKVQNALVSSIRDIVYNGSEQSKKYLKSLSKTYQMLFLLKCEPTLVEYFQSMAGKLCVYVCTSILVPAFSEIYLDKQNQRYWSLLKASRARGVRLVVNEIIVNELLSHLNGALQTFEMEYEDNLDFYSSEATELVDHIMVRAFIYALGENKVTDFASFLDNFISLGKPNNRQEIIDFLAEEFGIEYISDQHTDVQFDRNDYDLLVNELTKLKRSEKKAETDANIILTIFGIREKNNESKSSLDGYRTWWLSSDTNTHKSVSKLFANKYPVSCYMRPDFLYNYVSFTPLKEDVTKVYETTFPNLLGVQISHHISPQVSRSIRKSIHDHKDKLDGRNKAKLRNLIDELKSNPDSNYIDGLSAIFDNKETV